MKPWDSSQLVGHIAEVRRRLFETLALVVILGLGLSILSTTIVDDDVPRYWYAVSIGIVAAAAVSYLWFGIEVTAFRAIADRDLFVVNLMSSRRPKPEPQQSNAGDTLNTLLRARNFVEVVDSIDNPHSLDSDYSKSSWLVEKAASDAVEATILYLLAIRTGFGWMPLEFDPFWEPNISEVDPTSPTRILDARQSFKRNTDTTTPRDFHVALKDNPLLSMDWWGDRRICLPKGTTKSVYYPTRGTIGDTYIHRPRGFTLTTKYVKVRVAVITKIFLGTSGVAVNSEGADPLERRQVLGWLN